MIIKGATLKFSTTVSSTSTPTASASASYATICDHFRSTTLPSLKTNNVTTPVVDQDLDVISAGTMQVQQTFKVQVMHVTKANLTTLYGYQAGKTELQWCYTHKDGSAFICNAIIDQISPATGDDPEKDLFHEVTFITTKIFGANSGWYATVP